MKKRRWQMLDDYATLQMKPLFAWKAIYHNPTNCPYFLSNLWSKSPHKKAHSRKNQQAYQAQKNDLGGLKKSFSTSKGAFYRLKNIFIDAQQAWY